MTDPKIDISVALEVDEDWPVADITYDGDHWASVTVADGTLVATIYGRSPGRIPIPLDAAIESLASAKRELLEILGTEAQPEP